MLSSKRLQRLNKGIVIPWFNTKKSFSSGGIPAMKTSSDNRSIFKSVSTVQLIKQSLVYRMSKSEFVLKNGNSLVDACYKYMGKHYTNKIIEKTAGEIFTSGPNIKTLIADVDKFYTQRGIFSGANYVLEGCEEDNIPTFDKCRDYLIDTLDVVCKNRPYAHLAIKLSGLAHMDMFKKYHRAQHIMMHDLFQKCSTGLSDGSRVLTRDGIKKFWQNHKYNYTEASLDEFIEIAKFKNSKYSKDEIGVVEFFSNVHAHYINSDKHNSDLIHQIWERAEITPEIREAIIRFEKRLDAIISRASVYKTHLFVDAEQTYVQGAMDAITRQFQSVYHKNQRAFILNGCQSYLKHSPHYIRVELERWREEGIGMGIKLVRGAYMMEERRIASAIGYPSPVWDTMQDTHNAYNQNARFLLNNMNTDSGEYIFINF